MTREHLEIERKFDVDDGFRLPDLAGLPGVGAVDDAVVHELAATYHDTDDLRLLRARTTLRRREGGPDAGWHLKRPADGGGRRELHAPLGPGDEPVPDELHAEVAEVLAGAATGPVAALRTTRSVTTLRAADGTALAEVADDTVVATVPGDEAAGRTWREVEVELVDGDDALLAAVGERLQAAGARPADAPSKVGRVLEGRLRAG